MKASLLLAAILLAPQTIPEVEITAEPHHHSVLENKYVRVFNVNVAPHTDTLMHWHRHDYVYVILGAAHVLNNVKGKSPVEAKFVDGDTRFSPATFAHIAKNLSDLPFLNVTIEYLQDETLRQNEKANTAKLDATRGLDILHGGTAEILFVNDGVRATQYDLQPGGTVPAYHHQGPHLRIAVTDLDLTEDATPENMNHTGSMDGMRMNDAKKMDDEKNKADTKMAEKEKPANPRHPFEHQNSGASKWLPANYSQALTNAGNKPAKFITLEFPPTP